MPFMTCKILNCNNIAQYPYPCCSMEHGLKFKEITSSLKYYQEGMPLNDWYTAYKVSVEEAVYYSQIERR